MAEQVNIIIDNIANKLGTTAAFLVPEFAKCKMAEHLVWLLIGLLGLLLSIKAYKVSKNIDDSDCQQGLAVISFFGTIGSLFSLCIGLFFIPWLASPMGATCNYILDHVRIG